MSAALRIPPPGLLPRTIKGNQYDMTAITTMDVMSGSITNLIAGTIVIWYVGRTAPPGEIFTSIIKMPSLLIGWGHFFVQGLDVRIKVFDFSGFSGSDGILYVFIGAQVYAFAFDGNAYLVTRQTFSHAL